MKLCFFLFLSLLTYFVVIVRRIYKYEHKLIEASRGSGSQACDSKCDRLWIRFSLEQATYLIFSVSSEAKRGVEFNNSQNYSKTTERI